MKTEQCKTCKSIFLEVTWLEYRTRGYCSKECDPKYKKEKNTTVSTYFDTKNNKGSTS